jgi:hypothetical protein
VIEIHLQFGRDSATVTKVGGFEQGSPQAAELLDLLGGRIKGVRCRGVFTFYLEIVASHMFEFYPTAYWKVWAFRGEKLEYVFEFRGQGYTTTEEQPVPQAIRSRYERPPVI